MGAQTHTWIVRGQTIALDQILESLDETRVAVVMRAVAHGEAAREPHPMSSQRPMSPEERAELERVYQDRGCGVECDEQ